LCWFQVHSNARFSSSSHVVFSLLSRPSLTRVPEVEPTTVRHIVQVVRLDASERSRCQRSISPVGSNKSLLTCGVFFSKAVLSWIMHTGSGVFSHRLPLHFCHPTKASPDTYSDAGFVRVLSPCLVSDTRSVSKVAVKYLWHFVLATFINDVLFPFPFYFNHI
jgi:hypothetical protein